MRERDFQDEIIAEVRKVREELAARFDYDMDRLYKEIKRRESRAERPMLEAAPKRVRPVS